MNIVFDASWHVIVNDYSDVFDIKTSWSNISSDKPIAFGDIASHIVSLNKSFEGPFKLVQNIVSFFLLLVTVDASDFKLDFLSESGIIPEWLFEIINS